MEATMTTLTPEAFHNALHKDINKPARDFRNQYVATRDTRGDPEIRHGAHRSPWADAAVYLEQKFINVHVYLNFKQNDLSNADYERLKKLASEGIAHYWSRGIKVSNTHFRVRVQAIHRTANAIPVDLSIEEDKEYGRSMNPAILGIDASFIYNKGSFFNSAKADKDFKLVSAHEFGHSVLMYSGGVGLSWGHKGSTHPIMQSVKSSTPGYPKNGPIDLMKYYDYLKEPAGFDRRIKDSIAMEVDLKRLIWGAKIKWGE